MEHNTHVLQGPTILQHSEHLSQNVLIVLVENTVKGQVTLLQQETVQLDGIVQEVLIVPTPRPMAENVNLDTIALNVSLSSFPNSYSFCASRMTSPSRQNLHYVGGLGGSMS